MILMKIIWAVILAMLVALAIIGAIAVFFGILYYSDVKDRKSGNDKEKESE